MNIIDRGSGPPLVQHLMSPELNLGPQYRVLSVIAKGGMGSVYLAEMRNDDGIALSTTRGVRHVPDELR